MAPVYLILLSLYFCAGAVDKQYRWTSDSIKRWNVICPKDCIEIDLRKDDKVIEKFFISGNEVKIFCLRPINSDSLQGLLHIWHHYYVSIVTKTSKESTLIFGNSTLSIKAEKGKESGGYWFGSAETNVTETQLFPFKVNCLGVKLLKGIKIESREHIHATFAKKIMTGYPVLLLFGLLIFKIAPYLTKNVTFYYSGGIAIGIVASLLILLYVFGKFVPKKNLLGLGLLVGGYSFAGYVVHWIFSQGIGFLQENWVYVLVYVIVAGLISFAVLYRIGPAHVRTLRLIQWFLQLIGLMLIYLSFHQLWGVGVAMVTMVVIWYNMPSWMINMLFSLFFLIFFCLRPLLRFFKKGPKYLTLEEYEEQGRVETDKALQELRMYCRQSNEFWDKNLDKLYNQEKFLDFLSGKDHVTECERDIHEDEFAFSYEESSDSDIEEDFPTSETPSPNLSSSHHSTSSSPGSTHTPLARRRCL